MPESQAQFRFKVRFAAGSILVAVILIWMVSPVLRSAAPQAGKEKPVATVDGQPVYASEFLPQMEGKLYQVRRQEYDLKRKALEEVINRKLVKAEAAAFGMTEEELLAQEVDALVPEPTDAEVEQRFVMMMFRGGGQMTETKDDVREALKKAKVEAARQSYFRMLREKGHVKIYLPMPAIEGIEWDPQRVRGNPDAAITMVEFSDFQCPYCEQAYYMVQRLLQKYEGKVKLAYRDLPLQEVQSDVAGAGEASRCAGEQGKFWEYHDLLFENQDEYGERAFKAFAERVGLDMNQFTACLQSGKYKPLVKADFDEGIRLGATGTPAFFINGVFINGARPQEEFEEVIDALLFSAE